VTVSHTVKKPRPRIWLLVSMQFLGADSAVGDRKRWCSKITPAIPLLTLLILSKRSAPRQNRSAGGRKKTRAALSAPVVSDDTSHPPIIARLEDKLWMHASILVMTCIASYQIFGFSLTRAATRLRAEVGPERIRQSWGEDSRLQQGISGTGQALGPGLIRGGTCQGPKKDTIRKYTTIAHHDRTPVLDKKHFLASTTSQALRSIRSLANNDSGYAAWKHEVFSWSLSGLKHLGNRTCEGIPIAFRRLFDYANNVTNCCSGVRR